MAFVTVTGNVTRMFFNGKGADVVETFTAGGKEISKRWTVWWLEVPHGLEVGSTVEVSGVHSDQLEKWEKDGETRHIVKRSINKATSRAGGAPIQQSPDGYSEVPF